MKQIKYFDLIVYQVLQLTSFFNRILNKHSDEKTLVEAVKENFFAEHLFSDQYQDRQLFRWHLRNTYVDSAFMERVKEIEVKNSDDGSGSISGHRTTNTVSCGQNPNFFRGVAIQFESFHTC